MRKRLVKYIQENYDDLLALDLTLARLLGAPAPHTLSSYAHHTKSRWEWIINLLWKWLFNDSNHCEKEHKRRLPSKAFSDKPFQEENASGVNRQ